MILLPKICLQFKTIIKLCEGGRIFQIRRATFSTSNINRHNPSCRPILDTTFFRQLGFSENEALKLMSNKNIRTIEEDKIKHVSDNLQKLGFSSQSICNYPNILTISPVRIIDYRFKALEESGIATKNIKLHMIKHYSRFIIKDITKLKEMGIIEENIDVAKNILSYSDMPADMIACNIAESQTLEDTQVDALQLYLSWKFNSSREKIKDRFKCYPALKKYLSIRLTKQNHDVFTKTIGFSNEKLINNIFLLTEHPEHYLNVIERFPMVGLTPICEAVKVYPRIIMRSPKDVEEILQMLKEYEIPPQSLSMRLDVLTLSTATVRQRLQHLYDDPAFRPFFHHPSFLRCVTYFKRLTVRSKLLTESKWRCHSLDLLTVPAEKFDNRLKMGSDTSRGSDVVHYLHKELSLEHKEVRTILSQHPIWHFVPLSTITTTLRFLQDAGFSNTQICDALPVILYPKDDVDKSLKSLESLPNVDCCREQTSGRLRPELLLQLVLYSLERPYHFTGNGVWGPDQPPTVKPIVNTHN